MFLFQTAVCVCVCVCVCLCKVVVIVVRERGDTDTALEEGREETGSFWCMSCHPKAESGCDSIEKDSG